MRELRARVSLLSPACLRTFLFCRDDFLATVRCISLTMSRRLYALGLGAIILPLAFAQPFKLYPATSTLHDNHDYQDARQPLFKRSEAKTVTAVVIGATVAVGLFILFLLLLALYILRRQLLQPGCRRVLVTPRSAASPREHLYREQRRIKSSKTRGSRTREERRLDRSSMEKKRLRTNTPKQPSSTAASLASSFSPTRPSNPIEPPEMAGFPPSHRPLPESARFRPPVALPPLITHPRQRQTIDERVSMDFDYSRGAHVSRWSMNTPRAQLLRDAMQAPDPEIHTESSPSSWYPDTTPSNYGPSPTIYESSPERHVTFAPVELPGCDGPSTSPWRSLSPWQCDPSPQTPGPWNRGATEEDLVTPVLPHRLASVQVDQRKVATTLTAIPEERESFRHFRT